MGKLVIKFQGKPVGDVNLKLGDTTIGRHSTCDIVLNDDKSVSGAHAVIKTVGRKSTLEDLGSTNGTFVNGTRLSPRARLRPGDRLRVGRMEMVVDREVRREKGEGRREK